MNGLPDDLPAWTGYEHSEPASPAAVAPAAAAARPLITGPELAAHNAGPNAWRSLPGGLPLRLTAFGMEFILDDFGGYHPEELRSAHRVLYFASRTDAELLAMWIPPVPRADGDPAPGPLATRFHDMQAAVSQWAAATFAPCAFEDVCILAGMLWAAVVERMPVSAQKKSRQPAEGAPPESAPPISVNSPGLSAEDPQTPITDWSSPQTFSSSLPLPPDGIRSTASPALPSPSEPGASPPSAPKCGSWAAEAIGNQFTRRHFATGKTIGGHEGVTPDIGQALTFPDAEAARLWITGCRSPEAFIPRPCPATD